MIFLVNYKIGLTEILYSMPIDKEIFGDISATAKVADSDIFSDIKKSKKNNIEKSFVPPKPLTNDNPNAIDKWMLETFGNALSKAPDIQSSIPGRFIQGAADLPVGAMQLGANLIGQGDVVNKEIAQIHDRTEQGRGKDAGFDFSRFAGTLAGPVPYMAAAKLPVATSLLGKLGQGAAVGSGLAAATPVTQEGDYSSMKESQIAAGAGLGAVAQPLISLIGSAAGKIWPLLRGKLGEENAARIVKEALGGDINAAKKILAHAPDTKTAAQALASLKNNMVSGLGKMAERNDRTKFHEQLFEKQQQSRVTDVARIAGGVDQTAAQKSVQAAKNTLNAKTTPMREAELNAANQSQGLKPLDTNKIISSLEAKVQDPSIGPNATNSRVLSNVSKLINEWTEKGNGVIDAKALYEIRKSAVNNEVERLLAGADPKSQAKRAASILAQVRPQIDDAIEAAGGAGWRQYLKTFEVGMRRIDQQKLGAKALALLEQSPNKFVKLIQGNSPETVKKIFSSEFDINAAMSGHMPKLNKAAREIAVDKAIEKGASKKGDALAKLLDEHSARFRLPNFLNPKIAMANRALTMAEAGLNKNTMNALNEAMKSGKNLNALLNQMPSKQREAVMRLMANPAAQVAPTNALLNMNQQGQ